MNIDTRAIPILMLTEEDQFGSEPAGLIVARMTMSLNRWRPKS